jgi:hypothetical protein
MMVASGPSTPSRVRSASSSKINGSFAPSLIVPGKILAVTATKADSFKTLLSCAKSWIKRTPGTSGGIPGEGGHGGCIGSGGERGGLAGGGGSEMISVCTVKFVGTTVTLSLDDSDCSKDDVCMS